MSKIFVIFFMLFMHILDDFVLQPMGFLSNGKQRSWWEKNAPDEKYEYDYFVCLVMHSISWTFMIQLPIALYYHLNIGGIYLVLFILNTVIHIIVDDCEANLLAFSLLQDQSIHILQIICTAIYMLWIAPTAYV